MSEMHGMLGETVSEAQSTWSDIQPTWCEIQATWIETELCRLCTNMTPQTNAEKLFERNQRKLLRQIEEVIGQRLKNAKDLPQHICKLCEERAIQAHAFREQCVRAQQHFGIQNRKDKTRQEQNLNEQETLTENVVLNSLDLVKRENEERDHSEPPTLPGITEELLIKNELFNSGNDTDDYDQFNPLNENFNATTDEEEMMTVEPEIKLLAEDVLISNENEVKLNIKKEFSKKIDKSDRPKRTKRASEGNPLICDQCGKHFKANSLLEAHIRRHTGEKKFKCVICEDSFFINADLKRHMRKHTGELPFPCGHCERRFLDRSTAKKHERTHTNERPYACQQCGKAFTVGHTLANHMLSHTNERAFSCKMCNMAFKRKTHLVTHYRSMTHKQNEEKYHMNMSN